MSLFRHKPGISPNRQRGFGDRLNSRYCGGSMGLFRRWHPHIVCVPARWASPPSSVRYTVALCSWGCPSAPQTSRQRLTRSLILVGQRLSEYGSGGEDKRQACQVPDGGPHPVALWGGVGVSNLNQPGASAHPLVASPRYDWIAVKTSVTAGPHPAVERAEARVFHENQLLSIIVEALVVPEGKGDRRERDFCLLARWSPRHA